MQNVKTVSWASECRWQVFSSYLRQFNATYSDAIISKTKNIFWIFFWISEIRFKFSTFPKRNDNHSWGFPKLRTPQNMVRSISKRSRFEGSFGKQHGKRAKTLLKFEWQHLYHIYWSLWRTLTRKNSLLVICKISKLFPNTLSADGKYSLLNWDNLTQHIQIKLSQKQKTFSEFFSMFLKSSLNLEHFHKKNDSRSWGISDIMASEKHG